MNEKNILPDYIRNNITMQDIRDYAKGSASQPVTYRNTYGEYKLHGTHTEERIIEHVITGALVAIRGGADIQSALDTAELIAIGMLPRGEDWCINTYITVYQPIKDFITTVTIRSDIAVAN